MRKVLIIFHRVDYDGLFSALIARKFYISQENTVVETLGYNYGDALPNSIEGIIEEYNEICMVDCSFNDVEIMKKLYQSGKCILIDHHDTCISLLSQNGMENWRGLREIGRGACQLVFEYFFKGLQEPELITRLGLYDVWNHDVLDWDSMILPIQYALRTDYGMSLEKLILNESYIFSNQALANFECDGKFILKYLKKTWKGWVKTYSFEVCVAGRFSGICMLTPQFGSLPFETSLENDKYQVYVCANKKNKTFENGTVGYTYSVSFYSTPDKIGDFSLGAYAKSISQTGIGGGHACAAGMELTEEQFIRLVTVGQI